jgi:hypothetical protein
MGVDDEQVTDDITDAATTLRLGRSLDLDGIRGEATMLAQVGS